MEEVAQFLKNSVEIRNFGFNVITISSIITIVLTTYQMWGTVQQIRTVIRKKSADSILVPLFIFGTFYLLAALIYGVYVGKLSIVYNGLNFFLFVGLLLTIFYFKEISNKDLIAAGLFFWMFPIMLLVSDKKAAYMICSSIMLVGLFLQLIYLAKRKKSGSLEPKLFNGFMVTNFFWLVYGVVTHDWVLQVSNSISVTIIIGIVVLLRRYKDS